MLGGKVHKKFIKKEPPPGAKDLNIGKHTSEIRKA